MDDVTLGDAGEAGVLAEVFAALAGQPAAGVVVGPGDDTALVRAPSGSVLATTDTMVRGRDWLDEWSGPQDVGIKVVTQNLADLASMGGVGTGLLVTLVAPPALPLAWARGLSEGVAWAAARAGVPVVGGDLSSAPAGTVIVTVAALGELAEGVEQPVLRSGARPGDVLAVSGPLGRSGAGWQLLRAGAGQRGEGRTAAHEAVLEHHRRPLTDLGQGPVAARAGATAMIDVSDGLVRDADRVARASGVLLELDEAAVQRLADPLAPVVGQDEAVRQVLSGGEEHELLATFADPAAVPDGWLVLGYAVDTDVPGVRLGGRRLDPSAGGWDHFGG